MNLGLHNLQNPFIRKPRKRIGRGNSSGQGTYSGKGLKGQKARAGGSIRAGFEGGRSSLIIQTPKRRGKGFRSSKAPAVAIRLERLNVYPNGEKVTLKSLRALGIASYGPVKVVSGGQLLKKLIVSLPVSSGAKKEIEAKGGTVEQSDT